MFVSLSLLLLSGVDSLCPLATPFPRRPHPTSPALCHTPRSHSSLAVYLALGRVRVVGAPERPEDVGARESDGPRFDPQGDPLRRRAGQGES